MQNLVILSDRRESKDLLAKGYFEVTMIAAHRMTGLEVNEGMPMKLLSEKLNGRNTHQVGLSLLEKLYGAPLPEIRRTPLGKPYFLGENLHFSISHTKTQVFCAVSDKPIGIDAEELDRDIRLDLAEKILSPGEYAQFQNAPDKKRALLTFWVLKEAAGKCAGTGLQLWPNHTDFFLDDPRVQELSGCLVAVIEDKASP